MSKLIIYTIMFLLFLGRSTIDRKFFRACQFLSPRCRDSLWVARSLQKWSNSPATWEHYVEGVLVLSGILEMPGLSPKGFQGVHFFLCLVRLPFPNMLESWSSKSGEKGWFSTKASGFKQNTFGHDGSHNYIHISKSNRKHRCLLSALHLISYIFQIMLLFDVNIGNRVFTSLNKPSIDIPSSRSLLGVSGVQIYWTLWTFYQRNALSLRSWHHVDIIFQSVSHVYAKCGSPRFNASMTKIEAVVGGLSYPSALRATVASP